MSEAKKELTKAEEQVMQHLWHLANAFIKNILKRMPEPKPAYNTVSTIVRILEEKGFVGHTAFGKTHQYHPTISKEDYSKRQAKQLLSGYFNDSPKELVSFFIKERKLDIRELDEIIQAIQKSKS